MPAVAIIINGISRNKKIFYRNLVPVLQKNCTLEIFETQFAGHAIELAAQAAEKQFEFIIAAGGDGTLHQVVNGILMKDRTTNPVIGLIPMGTGNDFARLCQLRANGESLVQLIQANRPIATDVGKIVCNGPEGTRITRYFINACSVGMGPAVVKRLEKSSRWLGPTLTYWSTITTTFFTHQPQPIACTAAHWEWEGRIRVLAIANGRSFGHGLYIAPDAEPNDGVLNTFIAGDLPLWKFLWYQSALKSTKKVNDPLIFYRPADSVELRSPIPCELEAEGERVGSLPASVTVLRGKINFLK